MKYIFVLIVLLGFVYADIDSDIIINMEFNNNMLDDTGNFTPVQYAGSAVYTADNNGNANQAWNCSGANTINTTVSDESELLTERTVNIWIFSKSTSANQFPWSQAKGSDTLRGSLVWGYQAGSNIQYWQYPTGGVSPDPTVVTSTTTIPLNHWQMITTVWNGTHKAIYTNGTLTSSWNTDTDLWNTAGDVRVILCDLTGNPLEWEGAIDKFSIYSRALNSTEIMSLYTNQSAGNEWPYESAPSINNEFLAFGDSITKATALNNYDRFSWKIAEELNSSGYTGMVENNRGTDSACLSDYNDCDTSYAAINNYTAQVIDQNSKFVYVLFGVNDINEETPINYFMNNFSTIMTAILATDSILILSTISAVTDDYPEEIPQEDVAIYNNAIREYAILNEIRFAELHYAMNNNGSYTSDGAHLNIAGHNKVNETISSVVLNNNSYSESNFSIYHDCNNKVRTLNYTIYAPTFNCNDDTSAEWLVLTDIKNTLNASNITILRADEPFTLWIDNIYTPNTYYNIALRNGTDWTNYTNLTNSSGGLVLYIGSGDNMILYITQYNDIDAPILLYNNSVVDTEEIELTVIVNEYTNMSYTMSDTSCSDSDTTGTQSNNTVFIITETGLDENTTYYFNVTFIDFYSNSAWYCINATTTYEISALIDYNTSFLTFVPLFIWMTLIGVFTISNDGLVRLLFSLVSGLFGLFYGIWMYAVGLPEMLSSLFIFINITFMAAYLVVGRYTNG